MSLLSWTNHLPEGWEAKPLHSVANYAASNVDKVSNDEEIPVRLCNYTNVYNNEFITLALDFMHGTASEAEIMNFGLKPGDVILTKDSESWNDIGVPALVCETADDLVCGYHLALLRPLEQKMDGAFLFRCIQAEPVRKQLELAANGVTRFGIPKAKIGALMLPVPSLAQQRAIADYLDRETARLDALVATKERLLDLLAEKRRALITRAVTAEHWPKKRLRLITHQGTSETKQARLAQTTQVTFLPMEAIGEQGQLDMSICRDLDDVRSGYTQCFDGDVLVAKITPCFENGKGALLNGALNGVAYGTTELYVLTPGPEMDGKFLYYVTTSLRFRRLGEARMTGAAGQQRVPENFVRDYPAAVPPLPEQRAIADFLDRETARLDDLTKKTEKTIELLKERRTALIAAVVTGQINVGGDV